MDDKVQSLKYIKDCLHQVGYDKAKIVDSYPIIVENKVIYFDFVAFGHDKIQDTSTSCIVVKYCNNEEEETQIVDYAKYSASPILVVPKKESVDIWKVDVGQKSNKIKILKYDELGGYFAQNRVKFKYDKIVSSKQNYEQMTFFNAGDLFQFATKMNCKLLGEEFKNAIHNARKNLVLHGEEQVMDLTSITMHVIAAKILNDKLLIGKRYEDIHQVINILSNQYGDYFNKGSLYKYGNELIDYINDAFRKDISYRSIDNKILGNFYENTLFESDEEKNKGIKRELGIYYTPTCIVNNMLKVMPIELIHYNDRYVLDGSCGSGSLLIGAYERLKELLPKRMKDELKHKYLTDMILGIDIDRFACEVARLELLLVSIPYGNGWKIKNSDFTVINEMKFSPSIIVANPPYEEKRSGKLLEKATEFLDKYIDLLSDGGLLGIVMPESFLENKSGKDSRFKLLQNIDIYEIWSLPKGLFDTNNCATTVIIGRKVNKNSIKDNPFKVRIVNKNNESISNFKTIGIFDFDFVCNSQMQFIDNKDCKIVFSPLDTILKKIEENDKIRNYVEYTQGLRIPFKYEYPLVSDEYKSGYSEFLRNAKYGFDRYNIDWNQQRKSRYIKYDPSNSINDNFRGKGKDKGLRLFESKRAVLENAKVIFNMNSTPGMFWRTKAAIDRVGIYPSHSFWCFAPKDDKTSLEVIAALLNSKIANLYLGSKNRALNIKSESVLSIPMPDLSSKQREVLEQLVQLIEEKKDVQVNIDKIDEILYHAFALNSEEIELVEQYYSTFNDRTSRGTDNIEETATFIEVTGRILEIDLTSGYLAVKFVESDYTKYVKVDKHIPGWLLHKDTLFVCKLDEDDYYEEYVCVSNIRPLDFTYLDDEQFESMLYNNLNDYAYSYNSEQIQSLKGGA